MESSTAPNTVRRPGPGERAVEQVQEHGERDGDGAPEQVPGAEEDDGAGDRAEGADDRDHVGGDPGAGQAAHGGAITLATTGRAETPST